MHRVRVGLIGLAWVFLLVMLATTFLHVTGGGNATANTTVSVNDTAPSDPLAELGVAPGNPDADPATPGSPAKARPATR